MVEPNELYDLFAGIHTHATGELTNLMDGFYHNVEDGLFEQAYANQDQAQQRHAVELMRELRSRRKQLLHTFKKRIQTSGQAWMGTPADGPELMEERVMANNMAGKCASHFISGAADHCRTHRPRHPAAGCACKSAHQSGRGELQFPHLLSQREIRKRSR